MTSDERTAFHRAFSPRGIAVYGVSTRDDAMGSMLARMIRDGGYGGELVMVGRQAGSLGDDRIVTSARDAGRAPDHALIAVPAQHVSAAISDAADAGVGVATILSSGFSEVGEEGIAREAGLRDLARERAIRLIGPNCLGFMSFGDNLRASTLPFGPAESGSVSIIGQSGSVAGRIAAGLRSLGVGVDLWITIGNAVDVGAEELIDYLATRDATRTIIVYLEGIRSPGALRQAIVRARAAGKELVVLKSGRSAAGARTAASHTGSTASPDMFVDLLLRDAGAIRAASITEACHVAALLATVGRLSGRAAIVAPSGGDCTLAADLCDELGVALAEITPAGRAAMKQVIPLCGPDNPIDCTTMAFRDGNFSALLDIVAREQDVGYLVFLTSTSLTAWNRMITAEALVETRQTGLPVMVAAPIADDVRSMLTDAGVALFDDGDRLLAAVRKVAGSTPPPGAADHGDGSADQKPTPELLSELEALQVLAEAGVPMVPTLVIADDADLGSVGAQLGYPIVMKGILPNVGHKSGLGLVKLGLASEAEAQAALADLRARTAGHVGAAIVAQQAVGGGVLELILGVVTDPMLGKHVTVGMGGIWTDFLNERVWAPLPIDRDRARRMVMELRVGPGLAGARKGVHGDINGIVEAIVALGRWAVENDARVDEVEINPLIVGRDWVTAVDALVSLASRAEATTPGPAA